jgi:hypothetical protein
MKKYLEIYVGSRGLLENVEVKEFLDIEKYLENEKLENLEGMFDDEDDEDYREEVEGYWNWDKIDNGYYLGLGDEEVKYYVDMDCEKFKEYNKEGEEWNKVENSIIFDLLDKCCGY